MQATTIQPDCGGKREPEAKTYQDCLSPPGVSCAAAAGREDGCRAMAALMRTVMRLQSIGLETRRKVRRGIPYARQPVQHDRRYFCPTPGN